MQLRRHHANLLAPGKEFADDRIGEPFALETIKPDTCGLLYPGWRRFHFAESGVRGHICLQITAHVRNGHVEDKPVRMAMLLKRRLEKLGYTISLDIYCQWQIAPRHDFQHRVQRHLTPDRHVV